MDGIIAETNDVEHRLERLYDALETGKVQISDLAPRIQVLRHRQQDLLALKLNEEQRLSDKRVELADAETVTRSVNELHELLNNSQFPEKKSFVRTFVKEVKVTGDEVLITYTIPMLPNGNDEDKLSVLSFGHDGGPGRYRTCDQSVMSRPLYH